MLVRVRAAIRPTEDPARVEAAVRNLFPDARVERDAHEVRATATSLDRLEELVRAHQIPDSARAAMLRGRDGPRTRFDLGKQAALMGRPHFGPPPSALGTVEVEVETESEEALLYAVYATAPDTTVPPELAKVPRDLRPKD